MPTLSKKSSLPVQNMGAADRIVRGVLGMAMLGFASRNIARPGLLAKAEALVGGAFVVYSITGIDPLLNALGLSTDQSDERFIVNRVKRFIPGQGLDPKEAELTRPGAAYQPRQSNDGTVKEALSIGM